MTSRLEASIPCGPVRLDGAVDRPSHCSGLVVFAHGSGSGRASPRNAKVAGTLHSAGLATLLFDMLTEAEADDRRKVFDIPLLASRLAAAVKWARSQPALAALPIGLFGASTGAAAALTAAAQDHAIAAVVSRGGRPDLAGPHLPRVAAPTLLIVGGDDTDVLDLNRAALAQLRCRKDLRIVPGASHLFEEPGALDTVATLARDWFTTHLRAAVSRPGATDVP